MCPWNPLQSDNWGHKENMGSVGDFTGSGLPCLNLFLSMTQPVLDNPFKPAAYAQAMWSKSLILGELPPLSHRLQSHTRTLGDQDRDAETE